jgi:hypothetical protein
MATVQEHSELVDAYTKLLWAEAKLKLQALTNLPVGNYIVDHYDYKTVGQSIDEFIAAIDDKVG